MRRFWRAVLTRLPTAPWLFARPRAGATRREGHGRQLRILAKLGRLRGSLSPAVRSITGASPVSPHAPSKGPAPVLRILWSRPAQPRGILRRAALDRLAKGSLKG